MLVYSASGRAPTSHDPRFSFAFEDRMNERRIHLVFEISLLLKGTFALIECVGGFVLAVIGPTTITSLVSALTEDALSKDPSDFVATHVLRLAQNFTLDAQHFYAFYLLCHGALKVFLVISLFRNKLWAYPASAVVFSLFIIYQLYRFSYTHGFGLIVLTVFDVFFVGLIWHEYGVRRRLRSP